VLLFRAVAIAAVMIAAAAGCARGNAPVQLARPAADEKPEHNFRFRPPGPAWARVDPLHIDPAAALAYARSRPDVSFLVYVERPGAEMPVEGVLSSWKRQLESQAAGAVELTSGPFEAHGLPGTRAVAMATVQGAKVVYENWIVQRNGRLYQLLAWGAAAERAAVEKEARTLFGGFELIDPAARAAPVRRPARPYASREAGWSIDLGAPWMEWRAVQDRVLDVAVPALLSLLEVRNAQDLPRRPLRVGSWTGVELPYQLEMNGRWMRSRLWALIGDEAALVAAEWRPPDQPESECAEPLEKLNAGPGQRLRAQAVQGKLAAARFFVEVGRRLRESGRQAESAAYFAEAGLLTPADPARLVDEVRILQRAGRRDEAVRRIAGRLHGIPCASALRVEAAQLLAELGRAPEAIATWTSAFGCGYRDPAALSEYLRFLEREGRLTLAFHEAQAFADPADLPRLRGLLAAGDRQ